MKRIEHLMRIANKYRQPEQLRGWFLLVERSICPSECAKRKHKRNNDIDSDRFRVYANSVFNDKSSYTSSFENIQSMEDLVHCATVLESGEAVYAA